VTFPIETEVLFDVGGAAREGPLVSVVVTLFNYARFIDECLGSVAAQTHRRLELIVVDDASTDSSAEAAQAWLAAHAARFERTLLIRHRENQGLSQARNTAFEAARADPVFVLDADNAIYPRAIARLLEAMEDTGAGVAYSQLEWFGAVARLGYADVWDRELFKPANYVDAMALVSKAAWAKAGGYAHLDIGWEDFELWCRFVEEGIEGVFVPEILCRYRLHGGSMLRTETDPRTLRIAQRLMSLHPWLRLLAI
jgi:glycosyltransferase involved in cell wall biosynthesis